MRARRVVQLLCQILFLSFTVNTHLLCQDKWTNLTGVVRSQAGEPLAGVTIWGGQKDYQTTNENGEYNIRLPSSSASFCCVLQFRRDGYKTLTRAVDPAAGVLNITLQPGKSKWIPPDWSPSDSKRIGATMRFLIPKGAKLKRGRDVDYWTIAVGFGSGKNQEWMQIGGGSSWSLGLPLVSDMTSVAEVSERDMICGPSGIDIRGHTKDGKRWRFAGMWGETVTYRNASEQAARFFDSIIDGLHCDWEAFPGLGRLSKKKPWDTQVKIYM